MMFELFNINDIIATKSFELFDNTQDSNIIAQLKILKEIKEEYLKLTEEVFYTNEGKHKNLEQLSVEINDDNRIKELVIHKNDIADLIEQFEISINSDIENNSDIDNNSDIENHSDIDNNSDID